MQASETPTVPQLQGFVEFVQSVMQDWKVQGLGVAIVKDSQVIFSQGFGKRNAAENLPVTPNTLFAIGSCTKAFTTTALGILVDEGKLDWDTPIKTYLPSFKLQDEFATQRMTARDLVCHRSGLPRHDLMWYGSTHSQKELFDRLQYLEPNKDFRTTWQYQNLMYMTAGYLIETLSGQRWEDFVQQRILTPIGMNNSNFSVKTSQQSDDFSLPYKEVKDEVKLTDFYNEAAFAAIAPAGAINSSVAEMSKWVIMHLNAGKLKNESADERQIVSEAQLVQMHTPQMVIPDNRRHKEFTNSSYGLGWFIHSYRGYVMVEHGGNIDGFSALTMLFPEENMGMVVLSNMNGTPVPNILCYNIADRLLEIQPVNWNEQLKQEIADVKAAMEQNKEKSADERIPNTHPSHELDAYTGDFAHPGYGTLSVEKQDDALRIRYNGFSFALQHYHYDVFDAYIERFDLHMKVLFSSNLKGDIDTVSVPFEPVVKEITFKRIASQQMSKKSFLEPFIGTYVFSGISIVVSLRGENTLFLTVPGQPDYELQPYKGTEFHFKGLSGFSIEFKHDENGSVQEAILTQPYSTVTAKKQQS